MKINSRKTKNKYIFGLLVVIATVFCGVAFSVYNIKKAQAVEPLTEQNIKDARQNVLYKAIYANLKKCYTQMNSPIEESSVNSMSGYDSTTFFTDASRASDYLKFPNGVGKYNQSSCPEMITGWSQSLLEKWFNDIGEYDGLASCNVDAKGPQFGKTEDIAPFLLDIGYTDEKESVSVDGRKCFYLKMKMSDSYWLDPMSSMNRPTNGSWDFYTFDYCVKVDGNNKVAYPDSDAIIMVNGSWGNGTYPYSSGYVKNSDNVIMSTYSMKEYASTPVFTKIKAKDSNGNLVDRYVLDAYLWYAELHYDSDGDWGSTQIDIPLLHDTKDTLINNCFSLGYHQCGWYDNGYWIGNVNYSYGSLTGFDETLSYSDLKSRLESVYQNAKADSYSLGNYAMFASGVQAIDHNPELHHYKKGSSDSKYISYFIKDTSKYKNGVYEDKDKYMLYYDYLNDYYNVLVESSPVSGAIKVAWLQDDGTFAEKYIYDSTPDANDKRYVLDGSSKWDGTTQQDWEWIANQLAAIDVEKAFSTEVESIVDPGVDPGTPEDAEDEGQVTDEDLCYRNARSLGWVICPVIFGAREMADSIYKAVIPLIQTNESIVGQLATNDSGLYKAWSIFRNLANIIFVILFMVIIFSQLTGYGIDNYGIKRMLPKVIVTAILINLSFIICALAVDITNIIGTSIKDLFEAIGSNVGNAVVTGSFGEAFGQISQKVISGLAITGSAAIIAGIAIEMNGWAIVIPILLFLLTVVIAVFFALVVLGLRQAIVVILIVLSPLAFACNMLPNTENIFKKWWSTAKTMLMVYPIVGALTGIGYLTSRILLSADSGFIMVLVAGVLMVGPYFLIPSLTRKALDSVGSLGTRLGNMGRGARNGARGRINNSEAVKNFRGDHRDAATARRASRYLNSRQGRATEQALRDGKPISSRRANRYARAQAQANSGNKANLGAYDALFSGQDVERRLNRMQSGGFAAMEAGLENKAFEGDVADQAALWENDGTFANDAKFEEAVYNAAIEGEDAKLEALMRKAASGSDKQRENLFKGMSRAFATGNVGARTAGRYGAHLTSNGIYKSNDPSAYGLGTKLSSAVGNGNYGTSVDPRSFTQENYAGSRIFGGKVASASAFNFDDAEFNALAEKAKNGTAEEKQALANFMQGALDAKANDTTGQYNNVKPETIEQIKRVLSDTGMTPQVTGGDTLTVDHSAATAAAASAASERNALDAYTESVIKRVLDTENGGITAEEGEAMIRKAEEHWKNKHGGK